MFPTSWLRKKRQSLPASSAAAEDGAEAPPQPVRAAGSRSRWPERLVFLAITAALAFTLYRLVNPSHAWVILVDGRPVAAVGSRKTAQTILSSVAKQAAGDLASLANFDQKVTIEPARTSEQPIISRWQAQQRVGRRLSLYIPAYRLLVNDKHAATLSSVDEVRRAVESLLSHYVPKGGRLLAPPRIKEELALEEARLSPEQARRELLKPDQALQVLMSPAVKPRVYDVRKGDTATKIARRHGITLDDMRRANPEVDLDRINIGDRLVVAGSRPLLNVVTYVQETRQVPVPSWTQVIPTSSLKPGEKQVVQEKQPGVQEVTVRVTYLNGDEIRRTTQYGKVISEPVPGRVLVGEKPPGHSSRTAPSVARGQDLAAM